VASLGMKASSVMLSETADICSVARSTTGFAAVPAARIGMGRELTGTTCQSIQKIARMNRSEKEVPRSTGVKRSSTTPSQVRTVKSPRRM